MELSPRPPPPEMKATCISDWAPLYLEVNSVPVTKGGRENFGQNVGAHHLMRRLINALRRCRGPPVEERIVEAAKKQRTRAQKVFSMSSRSELIRILRMSSFFAFCSM